MFQNTFYTRGKTFTELIGFCSGIMNPGLNVIMGPSGSGKTS